MLSSTKGTAILLSLALFSAGGGCASAQERCSGTLCDAYYGVAGAPQAPPAGGTTQPPEASRGGILGFFTGGGDRPAAAPGTPAANQPPVQVQGGGLLGLARGAPDERCSGTICDLFYGGSAPERPAEQPAASAAETSSAPEPEPVRTRRIAETAERQEKPRCVAPPGDPWRCYR